MKLIPLTQGQFAKVDDDDFARVSGFKWCASWCQRFKKFYAIRGVWKNKDGKQGTIKLHRFIMNAPDGRVVDHINHDTLDNRKQNLRVCSQSQNMMNAGSNRSDNTSGHRGVVWFKTRGKWIARIYSNKKMVHLGYFSQKEDAVAAYSEARKKFHGEYAQGASNV